MKLFTVALFVVLVGIGTSEGFFFKDPPETSLIEDIKTAAGDLKESAILKKKGVIGAVTAVSNAKHRLINNIRDTKVDLIKNIVSKKSAAASAIKNTKVQIMKRILEAKMSPILKKIQLIKKLRDFSPQSLFNHKSKDSQESSMPNFPNFLGSVFSGSTKASEKEEKLGRPEKYIFVSIPQQPLIHFGTFASSLLHVPQFEAQFQTQPGFQFQPVGPEPRIEPWLANRLFFPSNPIATILKPFLPGSSKPQALPPAVQVVVPGIPTAKPQFLPAVLSAEAVPLPPTLQAVENAGGHLGNNFPGPTQSPCPKPAGSSADGAEPLPPTLQAVEQAGDLDPSSQSNDQLDFQLDFQPEPLPPAKQSVEPANSSPILDFGSPEPSPLPALIYGPPEFPTSHGVPDDSD